MSDFEESIDDSDDDFVSKMRLYPSKSSKQNFPAKLTSSSSVRSPVRGSKAPSHTRPAGRGHSLRVMWSLDEENALIEGVEMHGFQWKSILDDPRLADRFAGRSNVDLKDKYRNIMKAKLPRS
jgi:hypothetical protein